MKLLILGGTGAMGSHLCKLVVQSANEVTVTSRRSLRSEAGVRYLNGNALDEEFLKQTLAPGWDCIVDFMAYSTVVFRQRMPLLLASTKHYIFLSSARVYANSDDAITERSPRLLDVCQDAEYLKTDEYALAKARQEDLLIQSGQINWTIIRPYITYADERLQLGVLEKEAWLYRILQGRPVVFDHNIAQKVTTMTYGLDVANAISKLIGEAKVFGETYNITSNESRLWRDIWAIYEKILNNEMGIEVNARFIDPILFEHIHGSSYQILYDRLFDRVFDSGKIGAITGNFSFTTPEVGLGICIRNFLAKKCFKTINARAEGLKDKLTGSTASLGEFSTAREKLRYIAYRYGVRK